MEQGVRRERVTKLWTLYILKCTTFYLLVLGKTQYAIYDC
jgi:hypothetical protein